VRQGLELELGLATHGLGLELRLDDFILSGLELPPGLGERGLGLELATIGLDYISAKWLTKADALLTPSTRTCTHVKLDNSAFHRWRGFVESQEQNNFPTKTEAFRQIR